MVGGCRLSNRRAGSAGAGCRNGVTIDEAVYALDGVLAALRTVGLFGGKKVVWLEMLPLKHAVIMKNAKVKELLASLASGKKRVIRGQYLLISGQG